MAIHPGLMLKDELMARKIKQKDFACDSGIEPVILHDILQEKRSITPEIATLLEKALEIPSEFWLKFQAGYERNVLHLKERNIRKPQLIETWKLIKQYVPIAILRKQGLLTLSLEDNIAKIFEIFEVTNTDALIEKLSVDKGQDSTNKTGYRINDPMNTFAETKLEQWVAKKKGNGD